MPKRVPIALFLIVVLAGCASAKRSYSKGSDAESEGRWAQAAQQYIDAVHRDPEFPGARERALHAGNQAVQGWLLTARTLDEAGRYDLTLREYERIDRLSAAAAVVGVVLDLPAEYDATKADTLGRAIDGAFAGAEQLAQSGDYPSAREAYRKLERRYPLSGPQITRLHQGQFDTLIAGAREALTVGQYQRATDLAMNARELYGAGSPQSRPAVNLLVRIDAAHYSEMLSAAHRSHEEGRFREAYRHARRAVEVYGVEDKASLEAQQLLDQVLADGTLHVVALPVWRTNDIGDVVSNSLLDAMDTHLEQDAWMDPPLFVNVVDPVAVQDVLREYDYDRRPVTPVRAGTVATHLRGDLAAIFTLEQCLSSAPGEPETVEVLDLNGDSVHVTVYSRRALEVHCRFRLVNVEGRVLHERRFQARATRNHRHARHDGNLDDLLLTREQHAWFDARRQDDVLRELEGDIAAELSGQLATAVFEDILGRLP